VHIVPLVGVVGSPHLPVVPGDPVLSSLRVRNDLLVVDEQSVSVLGPAARRAEVDPAAVRLFPAADDKVTLTFRPPRVASTCRPGLSERNVCCEVFRRTLIRNDANGRR
jgi:hypothetical protein